MDASLKKTGNLLVFLEMLLVRPLYTIIRGNQETTRFRVLKPIYAKRLIQTFPLNHYMCFDFDDLKHKSTKIMFGGHE